MGSAPHPLCTFPPPKTLVEKSIRCAQLLCDCYPLRLGGDLGATARAFLAVQNDVYATGVIMQSQKSQHNSPLPFCAAQFSSVNYFSFDFIFLLWCGRPVAYVPCGQLYCSCISSCDWIEQLRLICDWVMTWMRLHYDKQLCPMTWTRSKSFSNRISRSHLSDTCSALNIRFPLRCLTCEAAWRV
jgi:hypothetical protein